MTLNIVVTPYYNMVRLHTVRKVWKCN